MYLELTMDKKEKFSSLLNLGYLPFIGDSNLDLNKVSEAYLNAGVNNLEFSCRLPNILERVRDLKVDFPDMLLGVASLVDYRRAREIHNVKESRYKIPTPLECLESGADFIVSYLSFSPETYIECSEDLVIIPGIRSANEIAEQFELGADIFKFCPAGLLGGPKMVSNIIGGTHGIYPIFATNGVTFENAPDYINAGASIIGISPRSLIGLESMERCISSGDYSILTDKTKNLLSIIGKKN